jgi:hypothetical protein
MEVLKMAEETAEQKAAREAEEAEAKKAAEEEEAAKKAAAAQSTNKPPEKDKGEDLAGKDVSKFSTSEMMDYIDKLKDENAKRRIANRSLKDAQTKMEKKLADIEKNFTSASKKLEEVEKEKKASTEAEKSEVERLKGQVEEFQSKLSEMEGRVKESDKVIFEKDLQIKKQGRETYVNGLLQAAGVKFSSDYEKQGFLADLLRTDADGDFSVNEEEVNYRVGQFVKQTKDKTPPPPETPPAGPTNRSGDPAVGERIKALTQKYQHQGRLGEEDQKELDELLGLAGQAAEWDPMRQGG